MGHMRRCYSARNLGRLFWQIVLRHYAACPLIGGPAWRRISAAPYAIAMRCGRFAEDWFQWLMKQHPIQVHSDLYYSSRYLTKERWISYGRQYDAIVSCAPQSCLEIGPGAGVITHLLRKKGIAVTTCDIDASVHPDYIASVLQLPFPDSSFDCVVCAQVLEHIPFSEVPRALGELRRVTSRFCVISLPYPAMTFMCMLKVPLYAAWRAMVRIPLFWRRHRFNGEHYWEMGMRGYSYSHIMRIIESAGFRARALPMSADDPYRACFILEKKSP
jgi:ubiquinone/menaquinone biosynthesis C-methylase UbiE